MKYRYIFLILTIFWTTLLPAQTGDISTALNRMSDSSPDWELSLTVNLNFEPANGLTFQLPAGMKVIPVSIRLNGQEMWLQNKLAIPDRDSVIVWDFTAQGLSLFFRNGLLKNGDMLAISCHASIPQTDNFPATVILKEASLSDNSINLSERDYARGTIPLISNQEEN
jgi:hypothetical protein